MRFSDFDTYLRADHLQDSTTVTIERFEKIMTTPETGQVRIGSGGTFKGEAEAVDLEHIEQAKVVCDVRR